MYRSKNEGLLKWVGPTGLVRVGIRLTQQMSNGQVYLPNYALIMVVFVGVFAVAGGLSRPPSPSAYMAVICVRIRYS